MVGRRGAERTRCQLAVEIKDGGSDWRRALLKDISTSGFRIAHAGSAPRGNSLWLRPEGGEPIPATIRWRGDGAMGCQFLYPLDEAMQAHLKKLLDGKLADDVPAAAAPRPLHLSAAPANPLAMLPLRALHFPKEVSWRLP